jgi:Xaa-Pro dipeptidase
MNGIPKAIKSPPSQEELTNRLEKVRNLMVQQNLDYYISFDPINIYYLTNFANFVHERPFILIIPRKGTMKFLVPLLEKTHVESRAKCELDLVHYFEFPAPQGENWFDRYHELIGKDARVGVESAMTLRIYDQTPGNKIKTDIIDEVRLIKTDYEIGRNVHACRVINAGHKRLLNIIRPGMMLFELYNQVSGYLMAKVVADIKNLNPIVSRVMAAALPPSLSYDPHNFTDVFLKMEEGGPHVSGVGGQVDGYGVEIERSFFLGSVPDKAKDPFDAMMEARALAYKLTKPGASFNDVDIAVRKVLKDRGYADKLLHRTGHGLGITGHEGPYIAEGYNRKMESGMILSIEPGIYIRGLGGFRHSDTVLITDNGNVSLTKAPETLEDLTMEVD